MSTAKILFVVLFLVANISAFGAEYSTLNRISDGDTFTFSSSTKGEYKCRIYGVDTPEKFGGRKLNADANSCRVENSYMKKFGDASTAYAHSVLQIGKAYKVKTSGQDKYGRYVCEVYVPNKEQETYNKMIVADGYAVSYLKYINGFMEKREYSKLQANAKRKGRGLWGEDSRLMDCLAREAM